MHAPSNVKKTKKTPPKWEAKIRDLQSSCYGTYVVKGHPPRKLRRCVPGCGTEFKGGNCWYDRIEHIVKHLEQPARASGGRVQQGNDSLLIGWALQQRIINPNSRVSRFRLCVASGVSQSIIEEEDEDEYMEGEEE
jgi:hypothetical protein